MNDMSVTLENLSYSYLDKYQTVRSVNSVSCQFEP